jgi:predicted transcriptional regulator of viral defense system/very-short-patch-repair endonuclease
MRTQEQTRALERCLVELAERQHGVVARRQLLNLGFETGAIRRRLRGGRLHRLYDGVYAVGHRVLSREGRWMAAVLFCGDGAVLSHRSAAAHWGIRGGGVARIHVTSPSKSRSRGAIRRHYSLLPADEMTEHEGIPVTTVPRTIFDLAAEEPQGVEAMLREAEYRQLYDRLSLPQLLERYPRRRGAPSVRTALALIHETPGRIESTFEERFAAFLDRHRLRRPHFNACLEVAGHRCRVDCLWPDVREIVELDGWDGHSTRSAFREDRARDRRLRAAGYSITRLAWSQLDTEPDQIAADLRALLN